VAACSAAHADDLGGEGLIEKLDHRLAVSPIGVRHRPFFDVLPGAAAELLDVGQKGFSVMKQTLLGSHSCKNHRFSAPKRVWRAHTSPTPDHLRRIPVNHMERTKIHVQIAAMTG